MFCICATSPTQFHVPTSIAQIAHAATRQGKLATITGTPMVRKTIKCVLTGCENLDVLYNVNGYNYHISTHHVELSCPVPDCGILIHSWTNPRLHLFTLHGVKSAMENVEAVASSLVNADYHGRSTTKIRESQENDAITGNERQVERFVQDEVDISEINLAGTVYGQDEAALDDDIEHEEEEDESEEEEGEYE